MRNAKGSPRRNRSEGAFTLIELLVVIAIITMLMAFLAVFVVGVIERAKIANTKAIVDALDKGCGTYRQAYNVYPPNNKGDSRCLHFYLGRDRMVSMGRQDTGAGIMVKKPAIIDFPQDWLQLTKGQIPNPDQPVPIIDTWDNVIQYRLPGQFNKSGVDIWSKGKNGQDDLTAAGGDTDDVCNWIKEY